MDLPERPELPTIKPPSEETLIMAYQQTLLNLAYNLSNDFKVGYPHINIEVPEHLQDKFNEIKIIYDVQPWNGDNEYYFLVTLELKLASKEVKQIYLDQRSDLVLHIMEINSHFAENTYLYVKPEDYENQILTVPTLIDTNGFEEGYILICLDKVNKFNPDTGIAIHLGDLFSSNKKKSDLDFRNDEEYTVQLGGGSKSIEIVQPAPLFTLDNISSTISPLAKFNESIKLSFQLINTIGLWLENLV